MLLEEIRRGKGCWNCAIKKKKEKEISVSPRGPCCYLACAKNPRKDHFVHYYFSDVFSSYFRLSQLSWRLFRDFFFSVEDEGSTCRLRSGCGLSIRIIL